MSCKVSNNNTCSSQNCETIPLWNRKIGLEIKNELKVKVNHAKIIKDLNSAKMQLSPNLDTRTLIGDELSCGQAQNRVNLYFRFDLTLKVIVD